MDAIYRSSIGGGWRMPNKLRVLESEEKRDPLDLYYECISACSWLGGEDVECVTRCEDTYLKEKV